MSLVLAHLRCERCRRPWLATGVSIPQPCPFCGHRVMDISLTVESVRSATVLLDVAE